MKLRDRVALITGASRGIGRACALRLAREGAYTIINYSSSDELAAEVLSEIESGGGRGETRKFDVADFEKVGAEIDDIFKTHGGLHILVNNAGITRDGLLVRMKEEDWDTVLAVNLKGVFNTIRSVARPMMKQRYGRIINLTSVVGEMGNAGQINYSSAKAGIIGLTKSVAKELGSRGITVNAVSPGFIETDMTKDIPADAKETYLKGIALQRFGSAEEVASLVGFLASEESSYITGAVIRINGGLYT